MKKRIPMGELYSVSLSGNRIILWDEDIISEIEIKPIKKKKKKTYSKPHVS